MGTDHERRLIAGRYRLERRIGGGAMGVVWLADDELLDRTVAVKQLVLAAGLSEKEAEQARKRSAREARLAARLQHRYAITVFDVADDDGMPVLVMEYLPSQSLAEVRAARGALPPAEVARIGAHAASALAAAHAAGIVHRDVKPGNILLGEDGTAKITDFGISHAADDGTLTGSGSFAGTPAFLSPEAARGEKPTAASDVFSLGATLYAIVEGRFPYGDTENQMALLYAAAAGRFTPPQQAGPLTGLLDRMMRLTPSERPAMAEVAAELEKLAVPATERRRNRAVLWSSAAAVVLAAAVVGAVLLLNNRSDAQTASPPAPQPSSAARQPTASPTHAPASSSSATPPPTSSAPSAGTVDYVQFVRDYYAMMPGGTTVGWTKLSPAMQQNVGHAYYLRYWGGMSKFEVAVAPHQTGPTTVESVLDFVQDGIHYRELHRLTLSTVNGQILIDSDSSSNA
ncbi:serine/threonine-protein kinase [Amycolatopsis alkalitolerans]|uniref:non-specific serine/threonine protein kinase n=1 Tax=Amycolatopsis alkalitolerans TaxID=2547244 RepID=A0A5C4M0C3_9PSEU|nr:serine/threonine-protein kinase [Amycolatopsis alkalitolerans]TNC24660.1 serine/threonine protein kinase [Amycolatopsis alkalitolerans]